MRIDASILGLAAWLAEATAFPSDYPASILPTTAKAVATNSIINFTYPSGTPHVFAVKPKETSAMVEWSVLGVPSVTVKSASLFVVENGKETVIATSNPTSTPRQDRWNSVVPSETPDPSDDWKKAAKHAPGGMFSEILHDTSEQSEKRQGMQFPVDLPFNANSAGTGSVTIGSSIYDVQKVLDKKLFLSLEWWDGGNKKGRSYTTPFAVSVRSLGQEPPTGNLGALIAELDKYDQRTPWRREGSSDGPEANPLVNVNTGSGPTSPSMPGTAASSDDPFSIPATPSNSNNDGPEGQNGGGGEGGGGGSLSTGALAGIVVGAVVGGLLIISALAYFLCFRRRSANRHIHGDVGYASDSGVAGMIAREKDMPGVNHSPSDAYADDNGHLHNHGGLDHGNELTNYSNHDERGVPAGVGAHQQSRDSLAQNDYSMYNNNGNADQGVRSNRHSAIGMTVSGAGSADQNSAAESRRERTRSVGGAPAVGRTSHQTSRPGSEARSPSRYAHLIEEGMTEDEIRRLEDEERQLDAAIEDAGRHGAGGGGRPKK